MAVVLMASRFDKMAFDQNEAEIDQKLIGICINI